ncbi:MAG TPA: hypothetical protein VNQ14_12525 [Woeseiaceae bacterium]|nr:hypothetical protein [Woeseiaceae bacterium]
MDLVWMDPAVGGRAAIAIIGAAAFAGIALTCQALAASLPGSRHFADCIAFEAAQRFRSEYELAGRKQAILLSSALVFLLAFAANCLLLPARLFENLPQWQLALLSAALVAAAIYAAYRVARSFLKLRRLRYVRDAHIATGHGLQKIAGNLNRVFHDVPCAGGIADSLVVGQNGIYAVNVIARKPGRKRKVRLSGDHLCFSPGQHQVPVGDCLFRSTQIAKEFSKALKHEVRVRTVIAVPGWEIEGQSSDLCLIVNERSLVMLRGWKDPNDYLMNEDVEALHQLLGERCTG